MKRILIVLVLALVLVTASNALANDFGGALKIGIDFAGKVYNGPGVSDEAKAGISLAAEGYYHVSRFVDVGGGLIYMVSREMDSPPGAKFWWVPIYASARFHPPMTNLTPYVIMQAGYAFHGGNGAYTAGRAMKGGFYWGAGVGIIAMEHFLGEFLYSESRGREDNSSSDFTYRKLTFSIGYNY